MNISRETKLLLTISSSLNCVSIDSSNIMFVSECFMTCIKHKVLYEGKRQAVDHYKAIYLFCRNIALDLPLPAPLPFTKSDKNGIPKVVKPLIPLLTGTSDDRRIGLTIARFYESIYCEPVIDTSPITEEFNDLPDLKDFKIFIDKEIPSIVGNNPPSPNGFKTTFRLTKGPNGTSVLTSHYDAIAVTANEELNKALDLLEEIFPEWEKFNQGRKGLALTSLQELISKGFDATKLMTGRLVFLPEAGGKTRTIAIGDYGSQIALRPLHDIIMKYLRKIKCDGTYNQSRQSERIAREAKGNIYSFDLSSATDRFPIEVQRLVVESLYGTRYGNGWKTIMTNRVFHIKDKSSLGVQGKTGQPLGLYSSGAVFAFTHHLLIRYCASLEGISTFRKYSVLGDDVVIGDRNVAKRYRTFMETLGVSINDNKSIISTEGKNQIEYAKRLFLNGHEISGLKYTALTTYSRNPKLVPDMVSLLKDRGFILAPGYLSFDQIGNDKISDMITILLIERGILVPPVQLSTGVTLDDTYLLKLKKSIFELEEERFKRQRTAMFTGLANQGLLESFTSQGIGVNPTQILAADGINLRRQSFTDEHPFVHEIMNRYDEIAKNMANFFVIREFDELTGLAPPLPVEYLPTFKGSAYFGDRKELLCKWHSSLVMKAHKHSTEQDCAQSGLEPW